VVNNLRIISLITFFIGSYLTVPKLIDAAQAFTSSNTHNFPLISTPSAVVNSQLPQSEKNQLNLNTESELPNFGAPDTKHGSGTR
jgi:hypothetical protein